MSTTYILPVLYALGLYSAYLVGFIALRNRSLEFPSLSKSAVFRFPRVTLLLFIAIAFPSILQIFFPTLLFALQRDTARFLGGEWWRLVTALFVQDGGIGGTVFNLVS